MAIKYSLVKRKNLRNPDAPAKVYAVFKSSGVTTVKDMVEDIREFTSLTEPDILSVIAALRICMQKSAAAGKSIRLDNFGTFRIVMTSEGAESEEAFNEKMIKKARLAFIEGEDLKKAFRDTKYKKE